MSQRIQARNRAPATDGWDAVADGVSDSYRGSRRAMVAAYERQRDADFHEWCRAIEDHGHHLRLLAEVWPEQMGGRLDVLEHLGSLLAEADDLSLFAETLSREPRGLDSGGDGEVLLGRIKQRQQALRAMARPLGRRLFAEPPAGFKRRLHQYWKVWRERSDAVYLQDRAA
jgi:hypothetical protein